MPQEVVLEFLEEVQWWGVLILVKQHAFVETVGMLPFAEQQDWHSQQPILADLSSVVESVPQVEAEAKAVVDLETEVGGVVGYVVEHAVVPDGLAVGLAALVLVAELVVELVSEVDVDVAVVAAAVIAVASPSAGVEKIE